jgi:hypothetical protein
MPQPVKVGQKLGKSGYFRPVERLPDLRQAPGIKFELERLDESMDQRLELGEIDFLIGPSVYAIAKHPKETLFEDTHTCVV